MCHECAVFALFVNAEFDVSRLQFAGVDFAALIFFNLLLIGQHAVNQIVGNSVHIFLDLQL